MAKVDVEIINKTLNKLKPPASIDFGNLIPASDNRITNVNKTAMCAIILFWLLTPLEQRIKIKPNTTGINAVTEDYSRYPHKPMVISTIELRRLAL